MSSTPAVEFQNRHFLAVAMRPGRIVDLADDRHPTRVYAWQQEHGPLQLDPEGTHFGFVTSGDVRITSRELGCGYAHRLGQGMYFSMPGHVSIEGGSGVVFTRVGYQGVFSLGGPIEERGRLRYIDGCSDSLLIPPSLKGDPCLNHLHFPTGIDQTRHTHPSIRVGIVAEGRGRCVVPENDDGSGADLTIPLVPGQVFVIPTDGQHSFFTDDQTMDIIAYHPDSDTGPDHDDHPMVNRTLVDGVMASQIDEIRTKSLS